MGYHQKIPVKTYKKILELIPISCVDIVIKSGGDFLLVKRKNKPAQKQWWFAGGRIIKGETLEGAALRKVKEETGLRVVLKGILGAEQIFFRNGAFGTSVHTINIVFLAKVKGKANVRLDSQSRDYKWFNRINSCFHLYVKKFLKLAGFR